MKKVFRLAAECLLLCLMLPQLVQAGGDQGKAPSEIGEKLSARKDYGTARRVGAVEERRKRKIPRPPDLLEQGKRLFLEGNYREAETVLLKAASRSTSKPEIHFYLGEVYMGLGQYSKAASEYRKAKRLY